jgi:hypothetical protein
MDDEDMPSHEGEMLDRYFEDGPETYEIIKVE